MLAPAPAVVPAGPQAAPAQPAAPAAPATPTTVTIVAPAGAAAPAQAPAPATYKTANLAVCLQEIQFLWLDEAYEELVFLGMRLCYMMIEQCTIRRTMGTSMRSTNFEYIGMGPT